MDFLEMVEARHSVRNFDGRQVEKEKIAKILKAALGAPSSKNTRSSSFMVVDTPELLKRIAGMRDFGSAFIAGAPLAILVMGDPEKTDLWKENASISATYLQLAAQSLGLGSCWVHVDGRPCRRDDLSAGYAEDYLKSFLPVPEGRHVLCAVAIGYPASATEAVRRESADDGRVITL